MLKQLKKQYRFLAVMRHGFAENNKERFFNTNPEHTIYNSEKHQDKKNPKLTKDGEQQIKFSSENLLKLGLNKNNTVCIHSPLFRATQSAMILCEKNVVGKCTADNNLTESRVFHKWEGKAIPSRNDRKKDNPFSESPKKEIQNRVKHSYHLADKEHTNKNLLFVTHGVPAKCLWLYMKKQHENSIIEEKSFTPKQVHSKEDGAKEKDTVYQDKFKEGECKVLKVECKSRL